MSSYPHGGAGRRGPQESLRGEAHLYNEGDLHSPRRDGSTMLIRIEGKNMDKIRRLSYEGL